MESTMDEETLAALHGSISQTHCENTPYKDWTDVCEEDQLSSHSCYFANTDDRRAAAQAELDFLRSLLPVETP
jgi:hypothetical protein